MQADVMQLLRSNLANFVNPEVIRDSEDLLLINFENKDIQVNNDELGVGNATRLMLIGAEEDGSVDVEQRFKNVRLFDESTVKKIMAKFPFQVSCLYLFELRQ